MAQSLTPAKLISLITKETFAKIDANFEIDLDVEPTTSWAYRRYSQAFNINCYVIEKLVNLEGFDHEIMNVLGISKSGFMSFAKKTGRQMDENIITSILVKNITNRVRNMAQVNNKYSYFLK